jgi:membrane protease YdiL (CAAX protease family)
MKKLFTLTLKFDRDIVVITIVSTLLLVVDRYRLFTGVKALDRFFLYMIIPLLITWLVFRDSPKEYGFQWGDWKAGLALTAIGIVIVAPILWYVAKSDPSMQDYYIHWLTPALPILNFIDLIGWEFFFRGWILFGYAKKFGDNALWLHAVPFALTHLGKPEIETISTIFGGFLFGLVAWRTRSFVYPFLIHFFVSTFTILVAAGVLF